MLEVNQIILVYIHDKDGFTPWRRMGGGIRDYKLWRQQVINIVQAQKHPYIHQNPTPGVNDDF